MAGRTIPLGIEEFHAIYDGAKPAFEYWQGVAIQKSMPTALHGIVQFIVAMLLEKEEWNTASEVRRKIVPDSELVPDVIAVRGRFKGTYPTIAPTLCIEILSPNDALAKTLENAASYISWGTHCVWIIDPEKRTAWTVTGTLEPAWISPDGMLRAGDTAIELSAVFAEADRKLEDLG